MKREFLFILASIIYLLFPNITFSTDINIAYVTAKDGLYIRKCPSINCKVVTLIPYKETVNIIQFSSDKSTIEGITAPWAEVKYASYRGWVFGGFLSNYSTENNYFKYIIIAIALIIIIGLLIIFRKYFVFIFSKFKFVNKKNQKIPEEVPPSKIESINLEQQSPANSPVINKNETVNKCYKCGNQLSTEALTCSHCGTPQKQVQTSLKHVSDIQQPLQQQTGRTESIVIQVAPDYENDKIKEMEMFGWNLQGRQEIHEEGDAYGRPSYLSNTYVIKTTVKNYVKLHFARSIGLPNLDKIKQIESEYFSLPFPSGPSLTWPVIFTGFFSIGILGALTGGIPASAVVIYLVLVTLGGVWISSRIKKRKATMETHEKSLRRMEELRIQLSQLT